MNDHISSILEEMHNGKCTIISIPSNPNHKLHFKCPKGHSNDVMAQLVYDRNAIAKCAQCGVSELT